MISVIVPLHNLGSKGDYCLKRCLDSLLAQTYTDFEVLLMENGSTDDTVDIAKEYCSKDDRFILHILDTVGVSNARNKGIELAQGEYITFIDGDDFISSDYIGAASNIINTNNEIAFISFSKSFYYFNTNKYKNIIKIDKSEIYQTEKEINTKFLGVISKVVKKSILVDNNIYFNAELVSGEDMLVSYQIYIHSNKYAVSDKGVYYYTQNRMNQTTKVAGNKLIIYAEHTFKMVSILKNELKKNNLLEYNQHLINNLFLELFIGNSFLLTPLRKMKMHDIVLFIKKHKTDINDITLDIRHTKKWQIRWFKRFQKAVNIGGGYGGYIFIKFMRIYRNMFIQPFHIKWYK